MVEDRLVSDTRSQLAVVLQVIIVVFEAQTLPEL